MPRKSRHTRKKDFPVICSVNDFFLEALDYQTYGLGSKSSRYGDEVARSIAKLAERLQVQMKS